MLELILIFHAVVIGFVSGLLVARWAISERREKSNRAIRLLNEAEGAIDEARSSLKKLKHDNAVLKGLLAEAVGWTGPDINEWEPFPGADITKWERSGYDQWEPYPRLQPKDYEKEES